MVFPKCAGATSLNRLPYIPQCGSVRTRSRFSRLSYPPGALLYILTESSRCSPRASTIRSWSTRHRWPNPAQATSMSTPKPEVFISFASRDGECFAEAVRVRLQRESPALGLWKDHLSLEGGRGWWDQIEAALNEARFLVLILTPAVLSE